MSIKSDTRLLYIEDEQVNRMVVSDYLEQAGFVVECAEDGMQGLALLRSKPYDLLLLDMGLPDINGAQVAKELRESADWATPSTIPVLVLTAFGPNDVRHMRADALANDDTPAKSTDSTLYGAVMVKPLDLSELLQSIEAHLVISDAPAPQPDGEAEK